MPAQPDASLSDEELEALDSFLLSDACGDEALSVDEVHGYLTALIVGPETVDQETWLVTAWGHPEFGDKASEQRMTGLMLRLYSDIAATLEARRNFEPLVVEVEDEGEVVEAYEGWCFGFMIGVEQHQEMWDRLPKPEQALLAPMAQLALLNSEEAVAMDDETYRSWVELIPGAVMGLYAFWHTQ